MFIDTTLLSNYIASKLPAPRDWIFIADSAAIFPRNGSLTILNRVYPVICFEHVLQLRDALEQYKDNSQEKRFCIVSQQPESEERAVLDYIFRSSFLRATPKDILEFAHSGYQWTNDVNQLQGQDLWASWELLERFRLQLDHNISPAMCVNVILSALLDIDLTGELSQRDALELWTLLEERDNRIADTYPRLWQILDRRVRTAIPMMEKLASDVDFVYFLWTMHALAQHYRDYTLFLPRIFGERIWQKYANTPIAEIKRVCSELMKNDAKRAMQQIKQTEFWLTQETQRLRLFNTCVGVDEFNPGSTAEFATREKAFCVTTRESLRYLAARLCVNPEVLEPKAVDYILHNITHKHLFRHDDTTYLRIRDTFEAFARFIELTRLLRAIDKHNWLARNDAYQQFTPWGDIYTRYLAKLEYLLDRFELLNFRCELLPEALVNQISARVDELIAQYNDAFAQLIHRNYTHWVERGQEEFILAKDFIDTLFMPLYKKYIQESEGSAFIILFDGMRWDGWNIMKPRLLQAFYGKLALEKTAPLLTTIPSTTEYSRCTLLTGLMPSDAATAREYAAVDDWRESVFLALKQRQIETVEATTVHDENRHQIIQLIADADIKVKVINFMLLDRKFHDATHNLSTLYEEVLVNVDNIIQPCLERIPPDSLVFILSDHGLIELKGNAQTIPCEDVEVNRRYVGMKSFSPISNMPSGLALFDADDICMPRNSGIVQYGFATQNTHLKHHQTATTSFKRYAHGGISMQEMIVPCAIFVPRGTGQLEIF